MQLSEHELGVIGEALDRMAERYADNAEELRKGTKGLHHLSTISRYERLALRFDEQRRDAIAVREKITTELERVQQQGEDGRP
jgi:hypothetical protein